MSEGGGESGPRNPDKRFIQRQIENLRERRELAIEFLFEHESQDKTENKALERIGLCIEEVESVLEQFEAMERGRKQFPAKFSHEIMQAYNHIAEALEDAQQLLNRRNAHD